MQRFESLVVQAGRSVGSIALNRPEALNALNDQMLMELPGAIQSLEDDPAVRCIVLTGNGSAFCSGFDLKEQMQNRPHGVQDWGPLLDRCFNAVMSLWNSRLPTIAAVNGHCLAGGFELAMSCDMAIASEAAVFGEPELKFGAGIVVMLMPWMTSPKIAKDIILSGRDDITAQEAHRLGLITRITTPSTLLSEADRMARRIAAMDPEAVQQTKKSMNKTYEIMGLQNALRQSLALELELEGRGTEGKKQFMDVARERGLGKAIQWRDTRFRAVDHS